jgi:hypothetical protein
MKNSENKIKLGFDPYMLKETAWTVMPEVQWLAAIHIVLHRHIKINVIWKRRRDSSKANVYRVFIDQCTCQ